MRSFRNPTRAIVALMSVLLAGCAGTTQIESPVPGHGSLTPDRSRAASGTHRASPRGQDLFRIQISVPPFS